MLAHPARDLNRQPAAYIVLDGVVALLPLVQQVVGSNELKVPTQTWVREDIYTVYVLKYIIYTITKFKLHLNHCFGTPFGNIHTHFG